MTIKRFDPKINEKEFSQIEWEDASNSYTYGGSIGTLNWGSSYNQKVGLMFEIWGDGEGWFYMSVRNDFDGRPGDTVRTKNHRSDRVSRWRSIEAAQKAAESNAVWWRYDFGKSYEHQYEIRKIPMGLGC